MDQSKRQVVFIHGGDAFRDPNKLYEMLRSRNFNPYEEKQSWREQLIKDIEVTHECHALRMPNSYWADYEAWKIWFEKLLPYLRDGVILVGHSLGGSFLFRYLSENKLPVRISQLHLLAPAITHLEDCEGFLIDVENWSGFLSSIDNVHLWHSKDDTIVPISHSEVVAEIYPSANFHHFTDRGHFLQPDFPELLAEIIGSKN